MRQVCVNMLKLQRTYLTIVILALMVPTFIIGTCLYYLTFTLLAEHIAIPEFSVYILFPVLKKVNTILIFGLPVVFLVLLGAGMIISNRLAGPVDRLVKEMEEISGGNYSKRITLRKGDDLKPVADNINKLLDKLT